MIIIVNGILGVGKSSTAQSLAERLENSVYIQGDDYSEFEEFDPRNKQHLFRVFFDIARHVNSLSSTSNIIVDYIFEDQEQLDHFLLWLSENHSLIHFYIYCDKVEHVQRARQRNREDLGWELQRIEELRTIMSESWIKNNNVVCLDTTSKPIDIVVAEIICNLHEHNLSYNL